MRVAGDGVVGARPAQLLHADVLAGDRLDDVGAGDEHVRGLVDHDGEVGDGGGVDRAACARAEDQADLGDDAGGVDVAAEDLRVQREGDDALLDPGAAGVVDADDRAADAGGEVHDLDDLLAEHLAEAAAEDGEVLGEDAHLAPVDRAVAGDDAVAVGAAVGHGEVLAAVPGQLVELGERARVEQLLDALAGGALALGVLLVHGPRRAGMDGLVRAAAQVGQLAGGGVDVRAGLDAGGGGVLGLHGAEPSHHGREERGRGRAPVRCRDGLGGRGRGRHRLDERRPRARRARGRARAAGAGRAGPDRRPRPARPSLAERPRRLARRRRCCGPPPCRRRPGPGCPWSSASRSWTPPARSGPAVGTGPGRRSPSSGPTTSWSSTAGPRTGAPGEDVAAGAVVGARTGLAKLAGILVRGRRRPRRAGRGARHRGQPRRPGRPAWRGRRRRPRWPGVLGRRRRAGGRPARAGRGPARRAWSGGRRPAATPSRPASCAALPRGVHDPGPAGAGDDARRRPARAPRSTWTRTARSCSRSARQPGRRPRRRRGCRARRRGARPVSVERFTPREAAAAAGVSRLSARKLFRALGYADPEDEPALGETELQVLRIASRLVRDGTLDERTVLDLARAVGRSLDRLATWQVETLAERVGGDRDTTHALLRRVSPDLEALLGLVWRRLADDAVDRVLVPAGEVFERAVGFADVVGWTQVVQSLDEPELAALVRRFGDVAGDAVADHGGRVIKTVGDEVMFSARSAEDASRIALELSQRVRRRPARARGADRLLVRPGRGPARRPVRHDGQPGGAGVAARRRGRRPHRRGDGGHADRDDGAPAADARAPPGPRRRSGGPGVGRGARPGSPAAAGTRPASTAEARRDSTRTCRTRGRRGVGEQWVRLVDEDAGRARGLPRARPAGGAQRDLGGAGAAGGRGHRRARPGGRRLRAVVLRSSPRGRLLRRRRPQGAARHASEADLLAARATNRACYGGVLGLPVPVVAAVSGYALGRRLRAGAVVRPARRRPRDGRSGCPRSAWAWCPGGGGTQLAVRRLGRGTGGGPRADRPPARRGGGVPARAARPAGRARGRWSRWPPRWRGRSPPARPRRSGRPRRRCAPGARPAAGRGPGGGGRRLAPRRRRARTGSRGSRRSWRSASPAGRTLSRTEAPPRAP